MPFTDAILVTTTELIATATPTPVLFTARPVALPSAVALESVSLAASKLTDPLLAVTVVPLVMVAVDVETITLIPSAAPTLTPPSLDFADLVEPGTLSPEPLRPLAPIISPPVCSSAVSGFESPSSAGSSPPAPALASAEESTIECASIVTSPEPTTVTSRSTTANELSIPIFSARLTPTPTSLAFASAVAIVFVELEWVALTTTRLSPAFPPESRIGLALPESSPMRATVSLTATVIAMAGLIATSPPAPASAAVVVV